MNKFIQAFLTGMFITFILDFFLFLGLFLNYINLYGVDVYYNILFADNQNWYIFFGLSILLGYAAVYIKSTKFTLGLIALLSFFSLLTLFEDIGRSIGEAIFMKKNTSIEIKKYTYNGDIIYDGRKEITFFDYQLNKTVKIEKKDLKR